jgi:hypothetical protein
VSPVCVVTEPWICRFWLSALDCKRRVNRSDVTCSIYYGHISPGIYGGLKSLQTTTSFQPCRPLSLAYFLVFFVSHTKNHATYFHSDKLNFKTKNCIVFDVTYIPRDSPTPSSQHCYARYPTRTCVVYK